MGGPESCSSNCPPSWLPRKRETGKASLLIGGQRTADLVKYIILVRISFSSNLKINTCEQKSLV